MSEYRQPAFDESKAHSEIAFAESIGREQAGYWWHGHGKNFWRIVWNGKTWVCARCGREPFGRIV